MEAFVVVAILVGSVIGQEVSADSLSWYRKRMTRQYVELGCTPIHSPSTTTPMGYNCSSAGFSRKDKCHWNGEFFNARDNFDGSRYGLPCRHCTCVVSKGESKWSCVSYDCDWPDIEEGCHPVYELGSCCPSGTLCETSVIPEGKHTCLVNSQTYLENHVFSPPGKDCRTCSCQPGFDGTFDGPWCKEMSCGLEFSFADALRRGCSLVYYGQEGCCPFTTQCPSDTDKVIHTSENSNVSYPPELQCRFGDLVLNIKDELSLKKECVKCSCLVPPLVTCYMEQDCH